MLKLHPCAIVALMLGGFVVAHRCPSNEKIRPCTCWNFDYNQAAVNCTDLQNAEELREALAGLKGLNIFSLKVKQSNLGDVPGNAFKDMHIKTLSFSDTKLTSIGDDQNPPFTGLENSLSWLEINGGLSDKDKPLTKPIKLSHLKELILLRLDNNVIPKLGNEWFEDGPTSLKVLYMRNTHVQEVGDKAFASLKHIFTLDFTGNAVTLKRSALPAKALALHFLDLRENEIKVLPNDMFNDMHNIRKVNLGNNKLQGLPESTWQSVLPRLSFVDMSSNPLICDSKIKWIFKRKLNDRINGECASPENLSGKELKSLTEDDISG